MGPAFLLMAAVVILVVSLALIVTALRHRRRNLEYKSYLFSGCISLLCPILVCVALGIAWLLKEAVILASSFIVAVLPVAAGIAGIIMLVIAWCRRYAQKVCAPVLISGCALLLYPLAIPAATILGEIIL